MNILRCWQALCAKHSVMFIYVDAKHNPGAQGWWKCWWDLQQVQCHQGKFQSLLILFSKISWNLRGHTESDQPFIFEVLC